MIRYLKDNSVKPFGKDLFFQTMDKDTLKAKKVADLREIAKALGVSAPTSLRKAELIDAIAAVSETAESEKAPVRKPEGRPRAERLRVIALNLLLWPRKALFQLRLLRCQLMDADALIRAKAVAALYPKA